MYEYDALKGGLKTAKYDVPRIADIEYLKEKVCPVCDLREICVREKSEETLSPLSGRPGYAVFDGGITFRRCRK